MKKQFSWLVSSCALNPLEGLPVLSFKFGVSVGQDLEIPIWKKKFTLEFFFQVRVPTRQYQLCGSGAPSPLGFVISAVPQGSI